MAKAPETPETGSRRRRNRWAVLAVTTAVFVGMLLLLEQIPNLYDTDSYYHLAVARRYWDEGLRGGLPRARQSVMAAGFGDKELLFHLLLVPFVKLGGTGGGKLAVAVFATLLALQVARLSVRAVGPWGALVPLWLLLTAFDLTNRLLRLRPEALSVLLLLVGAELAAAGRYRLLGALALIFAYSHTAWHTLPLLCGLWFLLQGLRSRRWDWHLVAYPLLGCSLAVILHPRVLWSVRGVDNLFTLVPGANRAFVLDWETAPLPAGAESATTPSTPYPRAETERGRALEGFVDFRRLSGKEPCRVFSHVERTPGPAEIDYEFAPYGGGVLAVDGQPIVSLETPLKAVLGRGAIAPVHLAAGSHTFTVRTCMDGRWGGFYLHRVQSPGRLNR